MRQHSAFEICRVKGAKVYSFYLIDKPYTCVFVRVILSNMYVDKGYKLYGVVKSGNKLVAVWCVENILFLLIYIVYICFTWMK